MVKPYPLPAFLVCTPGPGPGSVNFGACTSSSEFNRAATACAAVAGRQLVTGCVRRDAWWRPSRACPGQAALGPATCMPNLEVSGPGPGRCLRQKHHRKPLASPYRPGSSGPSRPWCRDPGEARGNAPRARGADFARGSGEQACAAARPCPPCAPSGSVVSQSLRHPSRPKPTT